MKLKLTALLLMPLALQVANAATCSSLQVKGAEIDGKDYIAEVVGHNGTKTNLSLKNYRSIAKSKHKYYLEPGFHNLSMSIWNKRQYIQYNKNKKFPKNSLGIAKAVAPVGNSGLGLLIEPNMNYVVELQGVKNPSFSLVSANPSQCNEDAMSAYKAIDGKSLSPEVQNTLLTINKTLASNKDLSNGFVKDIHLAGFFGAQTNETGQGLTVADVIAGSSADIIGLKAGDTITSVSGKSEGTLNKKSFSDYLGKVSFGDHIKMTVVRGGDSKKLSARLMPAALPGFSYQTVNNGSHVSALYKDKELSDKTSVTLDALLLELTDALIAQGVKEDVSISMPVKAGQDMKISLSLASLMRTNELIANHNGQVSFLQNKDFYDATRLQEIVDANIHARTQAHVQRLPKPPASKNSN